MKEREKSLQQSSSHPSTPVREHPTVEQLESLPVLMNGGSNPDLKILQVPPNPPENEDELNTHANGSAEINYSEEVLSSDEEIEENHTGMSLDEFIEHVRVKGRRGLHDEYAEIKARAPSGMYF